MRSALYSIVLCSVTAFFPLAAHAESPLQKQDGVLVDKSGMTVYTFDQDKANSGKSVCNDACAKNWPPVEASADAKPDGDYSLVKRDDGTMQWAYRGMPLYTFVKDTKPGDKKGDNVKSVWHVVEP